MLTLNSAIAGICTGAVYGLVALGYNIVFGATGVFNVAQGDLVMVGVMMSYVTLGAAKLPYLLAFAIVLASVTALSVAEERVIVRPFLKRPGNFGWFISTLGFSIVLESVATNLYGDRPIQAIPSLLPTSGIHIGGILLVPRELGVLGALIVLGLGVEVFYKRTHTGRAMRATAQDREIAGIRGIDPNRMSTIGFGLGGIIAAVGGFMVAPLVGSDPTIGLAYSLKGFVALAIGGFGNIRAGIVAALLLGVVEKESDLYVGANYEIAVGLLLLVVVLLIRPSGLGRSAENLRQV